MKVYTTDAPTPERIKVGVAEYAVAEGDSTLVTSGLGSCVGIALVDTDAGVAGLAHAMLPSAEDRETAETAADGGEDQPAGKYVDTAVPGLLDTMADRGADPSRIEARVAGGSAMFEFNSTDGGVGDRNVAATEAALRERNIPVVATDVGGDYGRSLTLDVATGSLSVRRAHGDTRVI
jgi:chemotaxis protein CheD